MKWRASRRSRHGPVNRTFETNWSRDILRNDANIAAADNLFMGLHGKILFILIGGRRVKNLIIIRTLRQRFVPSPATRGRAAAWSLPLSGWQAKAPL